MSETTIAKCHCCGQEMRPSDHTDRLRQRVAELEGMMKNAEPVAYLKISTISGRRELSFNEECRSQKSHPLYTSPVIPEGWVLVPKKINKAMRDALDFGADHDDYEDLMAYYQKDWDMLIAAAPKYGEKE